MSGPCLCGDPYCGRCYPSARIVNCPGCGLELVGPAGVGAEPVATQLWFCEGTTYKELVKYGPKEMATLEPCEVCWDDWEQGREPDLPHLAPDPFDPEVYRCPRCETLSNTEGTRGMVVV